MYPNLIPQIAETPQANTGSGDSSLSGSSFMCPIFCERQALLFYVESEPQGISPVSNVESLFFTP